MVGHIERFNPAVRQLEGRLLAPRFIEGHRLAEYKPRSLDIDVILDLMIHDIDLVLHLVRELPFKIEAAGTPVLTGRIDIANARLSFPGGAVANLTASRVSLSRTRKIRFFMPETYVSVLQDYLGRMTRMVLDTQGNVDKYLGDGIMAFWGAPVHLENPAAPRSRWPMPRTSWPGLSTRGSSTTAWTSSTASTPPSWPRRAARRRIRCRARTAAPRWRWPWK